MGQSQRSILLRVCFSLLWLIPVIIIINVIVSFVVSGMAGSEAGNSGFQAGKEIGHQARIAFFQLYGRYVFLIELLVWFALSIFGILPGTSKFKQVRSLTPEPSQPPKPQSSRVRLVLITLLIVSFAGAGIYYISTNMKAAIRWDQLHFYNGMITSGGAGGKYEEIPMTSISLKDHVYVVTHVRWNPEAGSAGTHNISWLWYSRGNLESKTERKMELIKTPWQCWGSMSPGALEVGHHRVDVLIDGNVIDTHEFDITQ